MPIRVPSGQQPGDYVIAGLIGFMTCKDGSCDLPTAARFTGLLRVADRGARRRCRLGSRPRNMTKPSGWPRREWPPIRGRRPSRGPRAARHRLHFTPGAAEAAHRRYEVVELNTTRATTLPMTLVFSFLGGLILNVMPCVLPVIGLKILSFVEQGGQKHRRILMLNVVYSAGMMVVFLVLATLAVSFKLGWGEHFNSIGFTISLAGLVFAMALSFLGVWEIPIPGFVGSGATAQAASRGGVFRRVCQGRRHHRFGHALQRSLLGNGLRLSGQAAARDHVSLLRYDRPGDGFALSTDRGFPALDRVFAQAGRLDGNVQAVDGLCAVGDGRLFDAVDPARLFHSHVHPAHRHLVCLLVGWPDALHVVLRPAAVGLAGRGGRGDGRRIVRLHLAGAASQCFALAAVFAQAR